MRSESGVRKDTNMFRSIDAVDKHGVVSKFRLSDFHFLGSSCGIQVEKGQKGERTNDHESFSTSKWTIRQYEYVLVYK